MSEVASRLKEMDDAWGKAESGADKAKDFDPVPDGEYQARVNRFDFHESKKDGSLSLRTEFELLTGDRPGWKVSAFHDLEKPERLRWTRDHLGLLGIEVESLAELEAALPQALDSVCDIALKSRQVGDKTYQNVYLNRVLNGAKASAKEEQQSLTHTDADRPPAKNHYDDEIPF